MMIWTNLLICLTAVIAVLLNGVIVYLWMEHEKKWMRIFCEKLGITPESMEAEVSRPATPAPPMPEVKPKVAFRIPVPGGEMFRKEVKHQ